MAWNLPPGCTHAQIEAAFGGEGPCDCCGKAVDDCICPECPRCGSVGDQNCYTRQTNGSPTFCSHALTYNKEQLKGQTDVKIARLQEQLQDHMMYLAWLNEATEKEVTESQT